MQFRTQIPISQNPNPIDYSSKIVSLGSCFAVNMAEKLDYFKFQNSCNPFGILFHPLAIEKLIDFAVSEKKFTENDIFFFNERWHCFDVHSDWSNANKEALLENLNQIILTTKKQLQEASHIIITYGTSWVYREKEHYKVVANCHKVPQNNFEKDILAIETIVKSIENTINLVQSVNPNCNLIFTVSPVRHIKDGFVENQLSKAHLIAGIHRVLKESEIYNLKSAPELKERTGEAIYFPSYEIMMDELRDYRFYAEDMLHPSQVAVDYIWKRFRESAISESAFAIMEEVETIQRSLSHRPFNPNSESHRKFEANLTKKITKLEAQYLFMKF